jgi:BR serine/threonine kinase
MVVAETPEASPDLTKRSWFGSLLSTDRDETYTIIVKGKPLASIKADLVQAFLSVSYLYITTAAHSGLNREQKLKKKSPFFLNNPKKIESWQPPPPPAPPKI